MTTKYFSVTGYVNSLGNVTKYFTAKEERAVSQHVTDIPMDKGGFVSYTIEELPELPAEAYRECSKDEVIFTDSGTLLVPDIVHL